MIYSILEGKPSPLDHVIPHIVIPDFLGSGQHLTNQMVMQIVSAVLLLLVMVRIRAEIGAATRQNRAVRGIANVFESICVYLKKEVAQPQLKDNTLRFLPVVYTTFFFILFGNLLGLIPVDSFLYYVIGKSHYGGTPTGAFMLNLGLALTAFIIVVGSGIIEAFKRVAFGHEAHGHEAHEHEAHGHDSHGHDSHGHDSHGHDSHGHGSKGLGVGPALLLAIPSYFWNFAPHVFWPKKKTAAAPIFMFLDVLMWLMLFVLEFAGLCIKSGVLAVRLFANMVAGHIVVSAIFLLIFSLQSWFVVPVSILGCVIISMLELFVAFLQAFVFTFLMVIFLGSSINPEH
ncbi:MAG: F0F1 ATP synthase subunit A [Planctomycetes bacterium]|nr:F0F1 ATP synthase subunit A [Planctomycetota bacterium]